MWLLTLLMNFWSMTIPMKTTQAVRSCDTAFFNILHTIFQTFSLFWVLLLVGVIGLSPVGISVNKRSCIYIYTYVMFVRFIKELCNKETSSEWISSFTVTLQMRTATFTWKNQLCFHFQGSLLVNRRLTLSHPESIILSCYVVLISKSVYETLMKVHSF